MINYIRHFFCAAFSFFVFFGAIQIGLRWESLQPVSHVTLITKNGQYFSGVLSQNWSGDFVVDDAIDRHSVTPSRMASLQLKQGIEPSKPWRIIFSVFLAMVMAAASWFIALTATTAWMKGFAFLPYKLSSLSRRLDPSKDRATSSKASPSSSGSVKKSGS